MPALPAAGNAAGAVAGNRAARLLGAYAFFTFFIVRNLVRVLIS
jgi:hypothetical protein